MIPSKSVLSLWRLYREDMIKIKDRWVSMLVEVPLIAIQSIESEVPPSKAMYFEAKRVLTAVIPRSAVPLPLS